MGSQKHFDYVIATPGYSMHSEYVSSLMKTVSYLHEQGKTVTLLNKYSSFVPSARELTATNTYSHNWATRELGSGEFTYGKVVWIDSDIAWEPEDFERLVSWDLDVVSGLYAISADRVAVTFWDAAGRPTIVSKDGFLLEDAPVEVGGVGFGFVAMKSGVFEQMERPWFKIRAVEVEGANFPINLGEDYSWCVGAREAGFKIWVDPLVTVSHLKQTFLQI